LDIVDEIGKPLPVLRTTTPRRGIKVKNNGRAMRALTTHEFQCSVIAALELRHPL